MEKYDVKLLSRQRRWLSVKIMKGAHGTCCCRHLLDTVQSVRIPGQFVDRNEPKP